MRLLLDANLSPRVAESLRTAGFDAVHVVELVAESHTDLLVANLPQITEDLERGVIVSLSPTRLAIRDLPIR